jgi:DNA polymerase IV
MDNSKGVKAMLKGAKKEPSKSTATSKKCKSVELPEVPNDKKVFKGLVFYWIPEDENSNHRKTLMAKARSHGAVIVRDLLPNITHVIVEEGIKYVDVVKKFKGTFNASIVSAVCASS